jgi:hypothetical protein
MAIQVGYRVWVERLSEQNRCGMMKVRRRRKDEAIASASENFDSVSDEVKWFVGEKVGWLAKWSSGLEVKQVIEASDVVGLDKPLMASSSPNLSSDMADSDTEPRTANSSSTLYVGAMAPGRGPSIVARFLAVVVWCCVAGVYMPSQCSAGHLATSDLPIDIQSRSHSVETRTSNNRRRP